MAKRAARGTTATVWAAPATSFVGRDRELAAITGALASGARLVTLVGPPGTGKTRLALRHAGSVDAARRVVLVDLAPAETEGDLTAAVARALGASLAGAQRAETVHARITRALARKPTLLVLDNFEQLTEHAPHVAAWLAACPSLVVLATSRERLRIAAEHPIEIPALGLPASDEPAERVLASEAVALLVSRATGFTPTPADADALGVVVRALEGLPLAIELAASRLPLLGPSALAAMLADAHASLDALGPAPREVAPRQATLRRAIAWSWEMLGQDDRRALAWLSLFRGAFPVEAAVAVLGGTAAEGLGLVQSLRDKSLLAPGEEPTRVRMLVAVRAFAAERLAERDDAGLARVRLVRHVAERAARERRTRSGRPARAAQAWLARETDALEAALDASAMLALDADVARLRAELVLALHDVARRIGPAGRDARALEHVDVLRAHLDDDLRIELLVARANARRDRGDTVEAARGLEEEARSHASSLVLSALGETLLACGRFEAAETALERALEGAGGDRRLALAAHAGLGLVAHGRGALDRAETHYAEALDLAISLGEPAAEARARRDLGNLALQRGELDRALAHYEEALAKRPGDDLRLEGVVRGNLGIVHQERGDLDLALVELRRARDCLRQVGDRPFEAHLSGYLGAVLHERGQTDAAREAYGEAIEILREASDVRLEGVFLAARAVALADRGLFGHADNDLALAARRIDEVGDPALGAALALHRASVGLAKAARGGSDATALSDARAAIATNESAAAGSDDARFALRLLRRAMPADALEVGAGGTSFLVPGRERVSLSSRPTLARILDALAEARLARPGTPLAWDDLLAAGWPDEKVLPSAAQNRVRVALSTLRTLGLRSLLVTADGGHRLDETITVRRRTD